MDKKIMLALALACVTGLASAQSLDVVRPDQGTKEIGFSGHWVSVGGTNAYTFQGEVGYYFTKNLVGLVGAGFTKVGGGSTATTIFVGGRYEFDVAGDIIPYVLAGVAFDDTGSQNTTTFRGGGGAQYMIRSNVAAFGELSFFKLSGQNDTTTAFDIGLRFFLK